MHQTRIKILELICQRPNFYNRKHAQVPSLECLTSLDCLQKSASSWHTLKEGHYSVYAFLAIFTWSLATWPPRGANTLDTSSVLPCAGAWTWNSSAEHNMQRHQNKINQSESLGFELRPSSGILKSGKNSVSETGSVSVLWWREGVTYSVGSLR
jgi:hypothetical protein